MKRIGLALLLAAMSCATTQRFTVSSFDIGEHTLTTQLRKNLQDVADAKNYAHEHWGIINDKNHAVYASDAVAKTSRWLYITPKHILPEDTNNFINLKGEDYRKPITKPLILHSLTEDLEDEKKFYADQGYAVYLKININFNDKNGCNLRPEFFKKARTLQHNSITHEGVHETIDTWGFELGKNLEESLSNFIGFQGALEIAEHLHFPRMEINQARRAVINYKKRVAIINRSYDIYENINNLPISQKLKHTLQQGIFYKLNDSKLFTTTPFNNAILWSYRPYTKHGPLIQKAYDKTTSIQELLAFFRKLQSGDSIALAKLETYAATRIVRK